jgi:hypothetical protein
MIVLSLAISTPHRRQLRDGMFPNNGHEAGAIVLCGVSNVEACPWTNRPQRRYLSREVIPIPASDVVSSSDRHFEWRKARFLSAYKQAREENLAIAFVHSHRGVHAFFSHVDDRNDHDLAELVGHRQAPRPDILSFVIDERGGTVARQLCSSVEFKNVQRVLDYGPDLWRISTAVGSAFDDDMFNRQVLAFGPDFLPALHELRIVIVGAGATGSAVVSLLMRLGAHYVAIIDPQAVDDTNTTRIHGSCRSDAANAIGKVAVAKRMVEQSEFDVRIRTYTNYVTDVEVRELLKSADVVLGCTDDHEGRLLINRLSYFYNVPVIDMGILIDPERVRDNFLRMADGRVTVVAPGLPCLVCRGVVDPVLAREEHLKRTDPTEYGKGKRQGYILNSGAVAPSVITLTTEIACRAVDELTARLTGYRSPADHVLRKFVARTDRVPAPRTRSCGICSASQWGRGDITPFLDRMN